MHPGAKPPVRSPFPRVYGNRDTYIFVSLHRQPPGPPAESVLPDSERGRRNLQHKSRARWPSTRLSRVPSHIIYTAATSRTRHGSRTWQTRPSRRVESAKWQAVVCRVSSVVSFPRPPAPWFRFRPCSVCTYNVPMLDFRFKSAPRGSGPFLSLTHRDPLTAADQFLARSHNARHQCYHQDPVCEAVVAEELQDEEDHDGEGASNGSVAKGES